MIWLRDWPWLAAACVATGVVLGDHHQVRWALGLEAALVPSLLIFPPYARRVLLMQALILLGFCRSLWSFIPDSTLAGPSWLGHRLEGAGWVMSNPRRHPDRLSFWLSLERVEGHPEVGPAPLLVQVRVGRRQPRVALPAVALGERWRLQGRLEALPGGSYPGDYDRQAALGRHGMGQSLRLTWGQDTLERLEAPRNGVLRLRLRFKAVFSQFLAPREAALLSGVVLGDPQELDEPLQQAFQRTGTSHLLAASGANLALVVALGLGLGGLLGYGPRPLALPCLAFSLIYVGLAGFESSIVRAGWMAVFALGARALGREADGSRCLALGAVACLLADPAALYDVGFQLSAGAVLSLVLFQQPFLALLPSAKGPGPVGEAVARGLSGGLAVLFGLGPLFVYHFQELNLGGLVANLLIAPPVEALLPLGLAQGLVGMVSDPAGRGLACVTGPWASGCIRWVELLALHAQPQHLARPDLWCLGAWLSWAAALLRPRRAVYFAVLGLLLLLMSAPGLPPGWSRCRLASRFGKVVLWWSSPPSDDVLVVEDEKQLPWSLAMLRRHGCVRVCRPLLLSDRNAWSRREDGLGLEIEQGPGSVMLSWRRFRLVWRLRAPISKLDEDATILIGPRGTDGPFWIRAGTSKPSRAGGKSGWNLEEGPVEIWTDGTRASVGVWSDPYRWEMLIPKVSAILSR